MNPALASIPSWTCDDQFYEHLLLGTGMELRTDPVKGKGLYAVRDMTEGDVVHEETAMFCSQNMDDFLEGIPVCLHCLKSLESPRDVVARVVASKRAALKLPYATLVCADTPVTCRHSEVGCDAAYCSVRCHDTAWAAYHAVLCPGRMTGAQRAALDRFLAYEWVQNGVDYSDTALCALRILAQVLASHRLRGMPLEQAYLPVSQLIRAPITKFFFSYLLMDEKDKPKTQEQQLELLRQIKRDPMSCPAVYGEYNGDSRSKAHFIHQGLGMLTEMFGFDETERAFITAERWSELLGSVLLNGQERAPHSYYDTLREAVQSLPGGGAKILTDFERSLAEEFPDANVKERLSESAQGQSIYAVGCLFNHSCDPNLQVTYTSAMDETMTIVALRDIRAGEELCISYIEEKEPFAERQQQLYEHYLFECCCSKCSEEAKEYSTK